jgi:dTDP-4-amino-4,6-dideoxygalactose transaminase
VVLPVFDDTTSFWLFSMHILDGKKKVFEKYLKAAGIVSSPVHFRNDLYDCTAQFKEGELFGVSIFDRSQICIPNGWWLTEPELKYIVETVNSF